ncbi:MAG: hypothetical protein IT377_21435 [Polyangiaceae bacterium]|nr:hypothetical protein [Polyangiaceae bacterium]
MRATSRLALLGAFALACGPEQSAPPPPQVSALPEGVAARVADDDLPAELVRDVARAQGISLPQARERLISDALFAAHARQALRGTGLIESAERSVLARVMLEEIAKEAKDKGPPTDAEVEEVTALRWLDVARPALVRTTHAVVIDEAPQKSAKARRVAERILAAVAGATVPADFEAKATAVDAEGLSVKVEHLDPVAADGRIGDPKAPLGAEPRRLELSYAQGAHAVAQVPGVSPLIESRFGFHVILAVERIPDKVVPLADRRLMMEREIVDRRARVQHQRLLETVNRSAPVLLDRGVSDLLARVQVEK